MFRILIKEDEHTIRENTTELLELEGNATLNASNGKQGSEVINLNWPDVI